VRKQREMEREEGDLEDEQACRRIDSGRVGSLRGRGAQSDDAEGARFCGVSPARIDWMAEGGRRRCRSWTPPATEGGKAGGSRVCMA
jgi:hypothetical protein